MCSSSRGNWPRIRLSSAMATFFAGFHRSFCSMLQLMSSISTVAVRVDVLRAIDLEVLAIQPDRRASALAV